MTAITMGTIAQMAAGNRADLSAVARRHADLRSRIGSTTVHEAVPTRRMASWYAPRNWESGEADFLVDGLFESDTLAMLFGEPEHGKSFVALDVAACVASGAAYHGRSVRQGPVIYIAGEGRNGLRRRLSAWERTRCVLGCAAVPFLPSPAALLDAASAVADAVNLIAAETPPVLIVIDTRGPKLRTWGRKRD